MSYGQSIIDFNGENKVIGQYTAIYEDPTNALGIANILNNPLKFIPSKNEIPSLPLSKSDFWLKFTIKNTTNNSLLLLELQFPTLQLCEFYYPENGTYKALSASDRVDFTQRKYKHQNFIFDINLPLIAKQLII